MAALLQMLKENKRILLSAAAVMLFFVVSLLMRVAALFALVMILWAGIVLYALKDLRNRAGYLVFLLAFFLFLLGGEFFELYFGYPQDYTFIKALDTHAYLCLLVSLTFLQLGFWGLDYFADRKHPKLLQPRKIQKPLRMRIGYYAKLAMCLCVIPYFWKTLDAGLYTLRNGYLSYYTTYQSRLPGFVEVLSELYSMFFFIYLATMPQKKKCLLPLGVYLLNGALGMLSGRRISFGVAVLVVLFYVLLRHKREPKAGWINKKVLIIGAIACPLLILLLHMQRYLRYGDAVEGGGILDMICRFLSQQGFSINILKLQKELEGDSLGCTSLYYTIHYLRGNVITRNLFDFPMEYYTQRTAETAFRTNCLADYIMYMVNADDFFAGHGLGTSYIAELYHDLGFFGIALGSTIYGILLNWLFSTRYFSYWKLVAGLMMLEEFVILPRYGADVILRPFYNLTKMAVLLLFILLIYVSKEKLRSIWNMKIKRGF